MKKAAWILTMVIIVNLICVNGVQPVLAATTDDYTVRIGLVSTYDGLSSLTIKNTSINFGYEVEGVYAPKEVFTSTTGFTFTVDNRLCYGSVSTYSSYNEAVAAIAAAKANTEYAIPGIDSNGAYRIYIISSAAVTSASLAATLEQTAGLKFAAVENDAKYRMKLSWADGALIIDGNTGMFYPQISAATPNDKGDYVLDLGERAYRGRMEVGRYNGSSGLTAISILSMEDYLYGVVACEMVSSWEMEALKAQAVCARSYAYAIDKRNVTFDCDNGYALYDTTKSQVYRGYLCETENTNNAVDATKGLMIYYRENVVKAYFYSTSGGHTENCENVWNVPLTYFRGVIDNTEFHQEKAPWIVSKTTSEITALMSEKGYDIGSLSGLSAQIRSDSGRIYRLRVTGSTSTTYLEKEDISSTFSLPSTKAKIVKYGDVPDLVSVQTANDSSKKQISTSYIISGDGNISMAEPLEQYIVISEDNLTNFPRTAPTDANTFFFAGMGYGHGVGMSQSGAQSLALLGYDYEYIINHYYNKVEVR